MQLLQPSIPSSTDSPLSLQNIAMDQSTAMWRVITASRCCKVRHLKIPLYLLMSIFEYEFNAQARPAEQN